ncbi:hypothetical protein KR093_010705 [Drosophila rubida]|uniref:Thioredoxin domain-containing protein 11 n=1 Tax=Drosophila rubida TaxID=30044 RepID=A0AAD4K275_9MUSC|nr:hypothetical protein KR093_010705 [Drosophila rubida]
MILLANICVGIVIVIPSLFIIRSAANSIDSVCPSRSVSQVRSEVEAAAEVSLLFYYVSWSSDARQARLVYDGVAHYYKDYAAFGAIDCWHLQCNCTRTHQQLPGMAVNGGYPDKWPTLIVNYGRQLRLQYLGAWHFEDLTRFMNNLIQPIDRVHSTAELGALWKISDAVVLALLDSADSLAYRRFVTTALHWLEFDPERNVRFAVTFGPSAKQMFKVQRVELPQLVVIDNRHGLHSYNESNSWLPIDILHWLRPKVNPLLAAGYGTPVKIAMKARHMPVLAMGIHVHQHQSANPLLMGHEELFRTKENVDCEQHWQQDQPTGVSHLQMLLGSFKSTNQLTTHCQLPISHVDGNVWSNYYRINDYLNFLWSQHIHDGHAGAEALQLLALHKRCRCLAHTHAQQGTPGVKIGIAKLVSKYSHLMWQHSTEQPEQQNRSLAVVLFDATKYRDFMQQLGIDQLPSKRDFVSAVQVFIVDAAREALHVMPQHQSFSYVALKEFIRQFYARQLPRVQRNAVLPALASPQGASAYINSYNRQLLLQALQQSNSTNVVLMFRPDCALSVVMSQALMQVSALLRSPDLHFIRFDNQANDLPWELSMPSTPALLVFPQSRPTESVVFPADVRANTANIMSFILAQLEPEQQLRIVLASCRRRMRHARSCLDFASKLVLQHVSQYLKYWEVFVKERDVILLQLKQFNEMHLAIESSVNL